MMNKRTVLKAMGAVPAACFCALPAIAQTQPYPSRPVTLVAPYGPGNTADILARLVAQQLGTLLGQPVVVENRPGAGGVGAINQVAGAAADGHTLLLLGAAAAISQSLFKPAPYDVLKSFVPVSTLVATDVLVLVRKDSKVQKMDDLVRDARDKKGAMMIGVSLLGTTQHLGAELFKLNSKLAYTIVPYKTASAVSAALMAGEIDAGFELISPMMGFLQGGQLRAIAIGGAKRSELLPQVPTVAESGMPSFDVTAWGMLVAPAQTPDPIVQRLSQEIRRVLAQPEVHQRFKELGQRPMGNTPVQSREFLASEISKWGHLIAEAKVTLK